MPNSSAMGLDRLRFAAKHPEFSTDFDAETCRVFARIFEHVQKFDLFDESTRPIGEDLSGWAYLREITKA